MTACGDDVAPLRIAVLMPAMSNADQGSPSLEWAKEKVNAVGGIRGRRLHLVYLNPTEETLATVAQSVAHDDTYVAAIGPGSSNGLERIADLFVEAKKPLVSFTSAAADLLRAYGGAGVIWRTRQSDIAQTELLVHYAKEQGASRLALLTTVDTTGYTFFSWFGFFAKELGFSQQSLYIGTLEDKKPCVDTVKAAISHNADFLLVASNGQPTTECILRALPPLGQSRPRILFADTGQDPYYLETTLAQGVEGFSASGDEAFEHAYKMHHGTNTRVPPHGASEHDAVLLVAYGLAQAKGPEGPALVDGLKLAVDGRQKTSHGWDSAGIKATLAALDRGERPQLQGATGPLVFEPNLYMDLASSKLSHYTIAQNGGQPSLRFDRRYNTGDGGFLVSGGVLLSGSKNQGSAIADSNWTPDGDRSDTWALIASLSSGFSNYRHQADALRQYRILRAGGIPDDRILLILADDLAHASQNKLKGTIRNQQGGVDLYKDAQIDYKLPLASADLSNIILGTATATTPTVVRATGSSNLYIYFVGHGGPAGMPIEANTVSEGLNGKGEILTPDGLRQALCTLRKENRVRRALVVIESCYAGVFGEAESGGLEKGCSDDGTSPLFGTTLITAANSKEVSYAGVYDAAVGAWVNDAFSNQFATKAAALPMTNLADLYTDVYLRISGSHASLFNTAFAGRITTVPIFEFISR